MQMERENQNNTVHVIGTVIEIFKYSHKVCGEHFYRTYIEVMRLSGKSDVIPVVISERLVDVFEIQTGQCLEICGQYRSQNVRDDGTTHLDLFVFAKQVKLLDENVVYDTNNVVLHGFICKPPTYRKTPLGREIADLLLAVNRPYGKSDYIPCICWGRNASYASYFSVGKHVQITGRIQSRTYFKTFEDGTREQRTAYEVSSSSIEEFESVVATQGEENEEN
jgi:primosomal replication protein N